MAAEIAGSTLFVRVYPTTAVVGTVGLLFAVLVNTIIALYYPFETADTGLYASNPFMYTSVIVSVIFLYSQWDENSSLAKSSNIITAIAAVMFSVAISLISLFGIVPGTLFDRFSTDKSWAVRLSDGELHYHLAYLTVCCLGLVVHPMIYCLLLFDIVASEETLRNVISSVTRNWQSIILTGLLALILVYDFSIIGHLYFKDDFRREVEPLDTETDMVSLA
ncbi:hypothetical protein OESDEN_24490, partial [Oesophagostomum dentatum]